MRGFLVDISKLSNTFGGKKTGRWLSEPKVLRSVEQFIKQLKVRTIIETECFFNLLLEVSQI